MGGVGGRSSPAKTPRQRSARSALSTHERSEVRSIFYPKRTRSVRNNLETQHNVFNYPSPQKQQEPREARLFFMSACTPHTCKRNYFRQQRKYTLYVIVALLFREACRLMGCR